MYESHEAPQDRRCTAQHHGMAGFQGAQTRAPHERDCTFYLGKENGTRASESA